MPWQSDQPVPEPDDRLGRHAPQNPASAPGSSSDPAAPPWAAYPNPAGPAIAAARRASLATWLAAAVQLLIFGCCAANFLILQASPELIDEAMAGMPAELRDRQMLTVGLAIATLVSSLLALLPMVALLAGFAVRKGSRTGIAIAMVTLGGPAILAALAGLLGFVGGLATGQFPGAVMNVAMATVIVAPSVWAMMALTRAWRERTV